MNGNDRKDNKQQRDDSMCHFVFSLRAKKKLLLLFALSFATFPRKKSENLLKLVKMYTEWLLARAVHFLCHYFHFYILSSFSISFRLAMHILCCIYQIESSCGEPFKPSQVLHFVTLYIIIVADLTSKV